MSTLLALEVAGRPVLVAGGGPAAARRAGALAGDGALVRVVAPRLCEDLVDLVARGEVTWLDREVQEGDLDGVWLVHAVTGDPGTDARVCRWATSRRLWSAGPASGEQGSAHAPATVAHAGLVVGVASQDHADPARAAAVRDQLAGTMHGAALDLRRRPAGVPGAAGTPSGRVVLVGGGPGQADLITVRGRRALSEADVVVADRLGPTSLLDDLPEGVEVIDVGKAPGHHAVPQPEINRILVEQARRGRTVVRLKGGDPFLFGRGGEEQAHCAAHGVPVEVVPGVSSALAAPAAAGIPLTHRGTVGAVHVAHGHAVLSEAAVASVVDGAATLVLLMAVALLPEHVTRLLDAGADPGTPVAIVERATLPTQRVTRAPLVTVAEAAAARGVRAPAVIVVGAVAAIDLLGGTA
jgi:uroporphyrin-III C-methyltransferase/precorrin-2 dehydrogenase/sirohydrochlorin ferrochelatase